MRKYNFTAFFLSFVALAFSIGSFTVALPELEPVEPPSNEVGNVDVPGMILTLQTRFSRGC